MVGARDELGRGLSVRWRSEGLSSSATGLTINVDGGLLFRMTRRVNGE